MLYVDLHSQCNTFDISDADKWLGNCPLESNSLAAFTCNYAAQEFNLLDIKVVLNERMLDSDLDAEREKEEGGRKHNFTKVMMGVEVCATLFNTYRKFPVAKCISETNSDNAVTINDH